MAISVPKFHRIRLTGSKQRNAQLGETKGPKAHAMSVTGACQTRPDLLSARLGREPQRTFDDGRAAALDLISPLGRLESTCLP
jgi:hypothetical protein